MEERASRAARRAPAGGPAVCLGAPVPAHRRGAQGRDAASRCPRARRLRAVLPLTVSNAKNGIPASFQRSRSRIPTSSQESSATPPGHPADAGSSAPRAGVAEVPPLERELRKCCPAQARLGNKEPRARRRDVFPRKDRELPRRTPGGAGARRENSGLFSRVLGTCGFRRAVAPLRLHAVGGARAGGAVGRHSEPRLHRRLLCPAE